MEETLKTICFDKEDNIKSFLIEKEYGLVKLFVDENIVLSMDYSDFQNLISRANDIWGKK